MSDSTAATELSTCGCCEGDPPPPAVYNRPGLSKLSFRIGMHGDFLARMVAALPRQTVGGDDTHPLNGLSTRELSDPAIALLDAFAVTADVLTFYQERIAQEGYLRTATERRSVLELANAIGYQLRPGVAASAYLAFTVEELAAPTAISGISTPVVTSGAGGATQPPQSFDTLGATFPDLAIVPAGTKVQSIPGPDEQPQTFEASAAFTARAEWNALRPRLTQPQPIDREASTLYFTGVDTRLKSGDLLLIVPDDGSYETSMRRVLGVTIENVLDRTRVDLGETLGNTSSESNGPITAAFKAGPNGLPNGMVMTPATVGGSLDAINVQDTILAVPMTESQLLATMAMQRWTGGRVVDHVNVITSISSVELSSESVGVFAFRSRLGFFGHNAPNQKSLSKAEYTQGDPYSQDWDESGGRDIWLNSQGTENYFLQDGFHVYLERSLPELLKDSWAIFESHSPATRPFRITAVTEASLADYALSGRVTGLELAVFGDDASMITTDIPFKVRKTTAHVQSERLDLADLPIEDAILKGSTELQLGRMVTGLQVGQPVAIKGELVDLTGVVASEILFLDEPLHEAGFTKLRFQSALQNSYVRSTVAVNANVAAATHGETVTEILGSGDASKAHQRFTLKRPPLTYVSAATADGTASTLQLRVNDILWQEAPRLLGLDPSSESYITTRDDNGKTHITAGDGKTMGARLPTGNDNIVATYRTGIGVAGMVDADQLTLLQSKPLGIRSVTNPLPADGAADPETRDGARVNAPLTVLTLDRIVSLKDYEDFTRAFAGVGKAQAVSLWDGENRMVHITIAAEAATLLPDGGDASSNLATHTVDESSALRTNLEAAILSAGDPTQPFKIDTYQAGFFNLEAMLLVDPRYSFETVCEAAVQALLSHFSFDSRSFAQPVTAAEIVTLIQNIAGVTAVDLDQLYRFDEPPDEGDETVPAYLEADGVRHWGDKAELLLINPFGITLEEMTE